MLPYITVLTPIYNGVEFLQECVNSVIQQTYIDWEMIIAVNGHGISGGDVAIIAQEIASHDSRIRVIIQPPPIDDKVKSLNDAMLYVKGEWVAILDCDDIWHPEKLKKQIDVKETVAKNVAVIGTFCQYFGERTGSPSIASGLIDGRLFEKCNQIINSSALIHRSYCNWRYIPGGEGMEDYELWMRIALGGFKLYNIPEVLVYHRIHRTSAFNSKSQTPGILQKYFTLSLKLPLQYV